MDEMGSSRLPLSERSPSPLLSPSPSSTQLPQSVAKESEECERLRRLAKKLRGQQAVLQNQLAVKELSLDVTWPVSVLGDKVEGRKRSKFCQSMLNR